ncbi:hypothetical protein M9H77_29136 [Catharanthus roseus]|uniref:Uncharacterized protein n=1 Tax=Catharanthus roseus TaxID=4058 RepID=A0ACC0AHC6_CATRO|nr:hypothetical protein M9H77_29136 [Catharanthus roseus]
MALMRSPNYVKSMISRLRGGGSSSFTTSTTPKMKPFSSALDFSPEFKARAKKGDIVPVCMALGMIALSTSIGLYTAFKELRHAPDVHLKKSRRETIPEVVEPDHVLQESENFIKKSFFRKLAHIEDSNPQIFTRQPKAETLKDVGTVLRSILCRFTRNTTLTTSTTPKLKPQASSADLAHHPPPEAERWAVKAQFMPVYVAIGMITLSVGFGAFTVVHQLKRAPNVFVKKSRRETLPELVEPERVAEDSDKFVKGSFFRKVAHVQDMDHQGVISDPIRGDVYAWQHKPRAITLKDVGVDPVQRKA